MPDFLLVKLASGAALIVGLFGVFIVWVILIVMARSIPFGSFIERVGNQLLIYSQFAWLRWNVETLPGPGRDDIQIVQGSDRFYIVVIRFGQGKTLELDKFPVRNDALKYLDELRRILC